jgi:hypothetical protein
MELGDRLVLSHANSGGNHSGNLLKSLDDNAANLLDAMPSQTFEDGIRIIL